MREYLLFRIIQMILPMMFIRRGGSKNKKDAKSVSDDLMYVYLKYFSLNDNYRKEIG